MIRIHHAPSYAIPLMPVNEGEDTFAAYISSHDHQFLDSPLRTLDGSQPYEQNKDPATISTLDLFDQQNKDPATTTILDSVDTTLTPTFEKGDTVKASFQDQ